MRHKVELLKDDAKPRGAKTGELALAQRLQIRPIDFNQAGARTVETRNKGIRTMTNLAGRIVKKWLVPECEYETIQQPGWIEKENHRTVLVGFATGAFALVKKARVSLT